MGLLDSIFGWNKPVSGVAGVEPVKEFKPAPKAGIVGEKPFVPEAPKKPTTLIDIVTAPGRAMEYVGAAIGKATQSQFLREKERVFEQDRRIRVGELTTQEALGESLKQFGKVQAEPFKGLARTVADLSTSAGELLLKANKPKARLFDKIMGTKTADAVQCQLLGKMPMHVMAQLVGIDDSDLVGAELFQQRITEQDSAGSAQPGEHGVAFPRALAEL